MARNITPVTAPTPSQSPTQTTTMQPQQGMGVLPKVAPVVIQPSLRVGGAVVPPPPKYRVVEGGWAVLDKCRVPMRQGKIVDDTQYDLDVLRSQGIVLERFDSSPEGVV